MPFDNNSRGISSAASSGRGHGFLLEETIVLWEDDVVTGPNV